jgi:putative transposase
VWAPGQITLERPKLRGTTQRFASRLLGQGVTRSNTLEALVIAGFVRGLSVCDVEQVLAEALGAEALGAEALGAEALGAEAALSKSTVSRICQAIVGEFDA